MDQMPEAARLPEDIDGQPLVQQAAALRPGLAQRRDAIERAERLPGDLVAQLRGAGFYKLLMPRALGGLEADPLTFLRVIERLSEGAPSVGWNVCNNSLIQLITLSFPDDAVEEMHGGGEPSIVAGTAVQGGGQAVPVAGGYRVSGRWSFGSGCQEAGWMLASFQILDDGRPRCGPDGAPLFWRGVFRRAEVAIVPGSWDVAGMRGTGSFDWTVDDVFLPERRTITHDWAQVDNEWSRWPGITFALPVHAWLGPHHSAIVTGIARAGIDALSELACAKTPRGRGGLLRDNPQIQDAVGRADTILDAGRSHRSATIAELWRTVAAGRQTTLEQRARARLAGVYATDSARAAMDLAYRYGGSTSFRAGRLADCWRDLHVAAQAATVGPEWYPLGGRAYLGMDPGPRLR